MIYLNEISEITDSPFLQRTNYKFIIHKRQSLLYTKIRKHKDNTSNMNFRYGLSSLPICSNKEKKIGFPLKFRFFFLPTTGDSL